MLYRDKKQFNKKITQITSFIVLCSFFVLLSFTLVQYSMIRDNTDSNLLIQQFEQQKVYLDGINENYNDLFLLLFKRYNASNESINTINIYDERINTKFSMVDDYKYQFSFILLSLTKGNINDGKTKLNINRFLISSKNDLFLLKTLWEDYITLNKNSLNNLHTLDSSNADRRIQYDLLTNQMDIVQNTIINTIHKINTSKQTFIDVCIVILTILIFLAAHHLRKTKKIISHLYNITTLIENMNNNFSFEDNLEFIYNTFSTYIPYNYIGIALLDEAKENLIARYGIADNSIKGLPEKMIGLNFHVSETSLGNVLQEGQPRIINNLEKYIKNHPPKLYNEIAYNAGIRSSISLPLNIGNEPVGVLFFSSNKTNIYKPQHLRFLSAIDDSISISLRQNIYKNDLLLNGIIGLAKLAEARDECTGDHLQRMQIYSKLLAEKLYDNDIYSDEVSPIFINDIEKFSPLHDIGKVRIKDEILLKPDKLNEKEFEEMKMHTRYGEEIINVLNDSTHKHGKPYFDVAMEIVGAHHEKWNGTGYPRGKKGTEIPLSARIVSLADIFDALISERPYKRAFTFNEAIHYIKEQSGIIFDPVLVDVFVKNQEDFKKAYENFDKK